MSWISRLLDSIKPKVTGMPGTKRFKFSARSLKALEGIHPDLRRVVDRALELTEVDFSVTEGRRTLERQKMLMAQGRSKTLNSRHLTGHAVDVVAVGGNYNLDLMRKISVAFKTAALELQIPIVWGGDWKSFKDTPHFELNREHYPS